MPLHPTPGTAGSLRDSYCINEPLQPSSSSATPRRPPPAGPLRPGAPVSVPPPRSAPAWAMASRFHGARPASPARRGGCGGRESRGRRAAGPPPAGGTSLDGCASHARDWVSVHCPLVNLKTTTNTHQLRHGCRSTQPQERQARDATAQR